MKKLEITPEVCPHGKGCVVLSKDVKKHTHSWLGKLTIGFSAVFIVATVIFTLAQVWPYGPTTASHVSGVISAEYTSDGIPVVREGTEINYTLDYCNDGLDVHTVRYLDAFRSAVGDADGDIAFFSSRVLSDTSYVGDGIEGCFDDVETSVALGLEYPTSMYYKLRTVNSYRPNFLSTSRSYETLTPLFYYAEIGEELP